VAAKLSVIIPTLNAGARLPAALDSLLPGVGAGVIAQVIISDGGSGDNTLQLADDAGAEIVTGPPGRGGQLRRGAELAKSPWLMFLHADTVLEPDWVGAVCTHIDARPEKAAAFRLRFAAKGMAPRIVAAWANLRSRVFQLPYGDQGLLISRAFYDEIGGYPDIALMEDVAIARALKSRLQLLECYAETSPDRYLAQGWIKRGTRNLWTLARYLAGADPDDLARSYHKR
jgi:rSAM/selenodomain-associated transferase 2